MPRFVEIAGHVVGPAGEPVEERREVAVAPALGVILVIAAELLDERDEILARLDQLDLFMTSRSRPHSRHRREHRSFDSRGDQMNGVVVVTATKPRRSRIGRLSSEASTCR